MDVQTLWNDRRDPHANPMSQDPRRMQARPDTGTPALNNLLHFLYRPGLVSEGGFGDGG
jgi:hypothetical protein